MLVFVCLLACVLLSSCCERERTRWRITRRSKKKKNKRRNWSSFGNHPAAAVSVFDKKKNRLPMFFFPSLYSFSQRSLFIFYFICFLLSLCVVQYRCCFLFYIRYFLYIMIRFHPFVSSIRLPPFLFSLDAAYKLYLSVQYVCIPKLFLYIHISFYICTKISLLFWRENERTDFCNLGDFSHFSALRRYV